MAVLQGSEEPLPQAKLQRHAQAVFAHRKAVHARLRQMHSAAGPKLADSIHLPLVQEGLQVALRQADLVGAYGFGRPAKQSIRFDR